MQNLTLSKPIPYRSEADLQAIADLVNACDAVDKFDRGTSPAELKEDYADPDFDLAQDLRLWYDEAGQLIALGEVWRSTPTTKVQAGLSLKVHPRWRYQGFEEAITAWAEARLLETAQGLNLPMELDTGCYDTQADLIALYHRQGYSPVRYFFRMTRDLAGPIAAPVLPEGFTLRTVDVDQEAEAWVEMFNQTFVDHWNHHDLTLREFQYYCSLSHYRADLNLVAVAPDGTLAAFCEGNIHPEDNLRTGRQEAWIGELGTRRGFRRRGLGRAMLLAGLRALQNAGMKIALLGVDADNPSGALGLYQSVGFRQQRRSVVLRKRLAG
jgi:mycothiol synthase